ncbi:FkbM family methyltransferase [Pelagibacteraceae bacterium]|jgi:FkbM family methyltransferase|nr:FkbM family methyltransferase [Pelagibacteraceae bacterium]
MIKNFINYFSILKRKIKYKKNSYSFNAVDLIIDYIFKNTKNGFYLDIGAQHPISNNNTYLLYKRGWRGVNIDLDKKNIDLFNIARPNEINLNYAVSNVNGEADLFFYHDASPINTLNEKISTFQKAKVSKIKKIHTKTLNNILGSINLKKKINYMNIDVEGSEEKILEGFDIDKYKPDVISIEYLDLGMKKLEFKNNDINNLMNSNLYKYFTDNNYYFINWLHGDLIFVHKSFRD